MGKSSCCLMPDALLHACTASQGRKALAGAGWSPRPPAPHRDLMPRGFLARLKARVMGFRPHHKALPGAESKAVSQPGYSDETLEILER